MVFGVVILSVRPSVRSSVCPSVCHTHALCEYFDTARKGNHSSFLTPTVVGGRCFLPSEISAQSDPLPSKNADFDRFPLIIYSLVEMRTKWRTIPTFLIKSKFLTQNEHTE